MSEQEPTAEATSPKMNPWQPISDAVDLKHLGKLAEECGELSAAVSRCIIQGVNEQEPVTGKVNRQWLEDEMADVIAGIGLTCERFGLNTARMEARAERKMHQLRQWHAMAGGEPSP